MYQSLIKLMMAPYLCLATGLSLYGQVPVTLKSELTDTWSQESYASINHLNAMALTQQRANALLVSSMGKVIEHQYKDLHRVHPLLALQSPDLQKFIGGSSFNEKLGYDSYGYVRMKYPIVHPNPKEVFRNKIIRLRYFKKLRKERLRVADYLNLTNPIPEGERILLVLSTMEKVIDIVLEHESY